MPLCNDWDARVRAAEDRYDEAMEAFRHWPSHENAVKRDKARFLMHGVRDQASSAALPGEQNQRVSGLGVCSKCDDHNKLCVCRVGCTCPLGHAMSEEQK